jgi:hypothetical protein
MSNTDMKRHGESHYPIFVIGPPRSGTSIMMRAVRCLLPTYVSFDEGHFLDLIPHVTAAVDHFYWVTKKHYHYYQNFMLAKVDASATKSVLVNGIIATAEDIYKTPYFIEKTHGPSMIYAMPNLIDHYPYGRVIFMRRRALEYMRSVMKKFTNDTWNDNLELWTKCMQARIQTSGRLGSRCMEFDQYALYNKPDVAAALLVRHLGCDESAAAVAANVFTNELVEKTAGTTFEPMKLSDLNLSKEAELDFVSKTKSYFEHFGWTYDEQYFRRSPGSVRQ